MPRRRYVHGCIVAGLAKKLGVARKPHPPGERGGARRGYNDGKAGGARRGHNDGKAGGLQIGSFEKLI